VAMATAFRLGVEAGRMGYESGLSPARREASATSPLTGFLDE
jgi:thiazole synthase